MLEAKKSYWYLQIVSKFLSNDAHNSWERTLCKLSHINVLGSIIYKVNNENYWWLEISRNFCCCFLLSIFSKLQSALGLSFFIAYCKWLQHNNPFMQDKWIFSIQTCTFQSCSFKILWGVEFKRLKQNLYSVRHTIIVFI